MPTPADLKARYPEFDAVSESRIAGVITETALDVGEAWPEEYRKPARIALAAHLLAMEGALRGDQTAGASIAGDVASVSVGDVSTSFASPASASTGGASARFEGTAYGKRFLELRRLAFGVNAQVVRA